VKISIVVPAFNEEKLISESLQSIHDAASAFSALQWETELIVCDNNSTDQTAELARRAGAKVVFEPVNQIGRARNAGAASATGDWLIFIDADSQPSAGLFSEVACAIQTGKYLAGGSTVKLAGNYPVGRAITGAWNVLSRIQKWGPGSFIFCEREVFQALGGFSQELFASEELEFFRRLKKLVKRRGKKIIILTKHPLLTSARKMHLYSPWEHLRFLIGTVLRIGKPLRNRQQCFIWYDGRR